MTLDDCNILNFVNEKFALNLESTSQYYRLDGIDKNNKVICEIKTRSCNKDKYEDTMVGQDKIDFAKENYADYKFLLIFQFDDGIYYYEYSDNDNHRQSLGGRSDRGRPEFKQYCFISKDLLKIM